MATARFHSHLHLEGVLSKSRGGETLTRNEVRFLLDLRREEDLSLLFQSAREARACRFGNAIFLYGFVYFSTWCRNDCIFCLYRRSNPIAKRYRKSPDEVIEIARGLAESGVHLIDLTMGEDRFFWENGERANGLVDLVGVLKSETGLPVMISPGVIPKEALRFLCAGGLDWYACYQETHNRSLFGNLRPGQDYDERMASKQEARGMGLLIEEGILSGVGETSDDIVTSLEAMKALRAHQIRAMTFIPQKGTPLEKIPPPSSQRELVIIALMRLLFPDRLIPASLDVGGIKGLRERLLAGANVVTSLIPPHSGLGGVAQSVLDVDEGYRTVQGVAPTLEELGLRMATSREYGHWVDRERGRSTARSNQREIRP